MPYIIREDGVNFVIPSYRDVLTVKRKADLVKELTTLSQSYGEYVTFQDLGSQRYSISLSLDSGYLLGETVWQYFNRPYDMIYCETVPNTNEVILVVVKNGEVYLDGSFPADSVPEELVIFLTQQNNFEIYTYGQVPISETPAEGKFSFDAASIKSFTVLDKPVFSELPLIPAYHFKPINVVLHEQGVNAIPLKKIAIILGILAIGPLLYLLWQFMQPPPPPEEQMEPNPFQVYVDSLSSPAPDQELADFVGQFRMFYTAPGWYVDSVTYSTGNYVVKMVTKGATIDSIRRWSNDNNLSAFLKPDGVYVSGGIPLHARKMPKVVYPLKDILTLFIDRLQKVYTLTGLALSTMPATDSTNSMRISITVTNVSPSVIDMIAEQFKDLPLTQLSFTFKEANSQTLTGSITIVAMGS